MTKTLAIQVFIDFVEREGRIPTAREFVDLGYSRSHYYKVKNDYYKLVKEEENKWTFR